MVWSLHGDDIRLNVTDRGENSWGRLMEAAQSGDRNSYARLLHEILPHVRMVAALYRDGPDATENMVRDVLAALDRLRHTYDPRRPFNGWLSAISHRQCRKAAGRRQG
jgi:RNA polymerase sigma-70 factor (ECF subfamily)